MSIGTTPAFGGGTLSPTPFVVRLYAARIGDRFRLLPGGLAMAVPKAPAVALTAPEGRARDVWVISDEPVSPHVSLWKPVLENVQVQRTGRGIQSRVADNLFWLGRYAERTDVTLRLMRAALSRLEEDSVVAQDLGGVRRALDTLLAKDKAVTARDAPATDQAIKDRVRILWADPEREHALGASLDHMQRVANFVRDRLSLEAWRTLKALQTGHTWRTVIPASTGEAVDRLDEGIRHMAAFYGLMNENMTRNHGWRFLDMGRRLERAIGISELLAVLFGQAEAEEYETGNLQFMLEVADSFITYRSRYRFTPVLPLVLDLLMLDETNPRSLGFQLSAMTGHLEHLPLASQNPARTPEQRQILELLTDVRLSDVGLLAEPAANGQRSELKKLLNKQITGLPALSGLVTRRYISLTDDKPRRVQTRLSVQT